LPIRWYERCSSARFKFPRYGRPPQIEIRIAAWVSGKGTKRKVMPALKLSFRAREYGNNGKQTGEIVWCGSCLQE